MHNDWSVYDKIFNRWYAYHIKIEMLLTQSTTIIYLKKGIYVRAILYKWRIYAKSIYILE